MSVSTACKGPASDGNELGVQDSVLFGSATSHPNAPRENLDGKEKRHLLKKQHQGFKIIPRSSLKVHGR